MRSWFNFIVSLLLLVATILSALMSARYAQEEEFLGAGYYLVISALAFAAARLYAKRL